MQTQDCPSYRKRRAPVPISPFRAPLPTVAATRISACVSSWRVPRHPERWQLAHSQMPSSRRSWNAACRLHGVAFHHPTAMLLHGVCWSGAGTRITACRRTCHQRAFPSSDMPTSRSIRIRSRRAAWNSPCRRLASASVTLDGLDRAATRAILLVNRRLRAAVCSAPDTRLIGGVASVPPSCATNAPRSAVGFSIASLIESSSMFGDRAGAALATPPGPP
jgi:hypothetical protein